MHALIVGAGLAGPCLALSLAKHGIRSTLFELRPGPSDSGGSISLGPHGLRVLDKYAGVYDRIKASGFTYRRFGAYSEEGEAFGEIYVGEKGKDEDECYPAVRIMRTSLQKVMIGAVEDTKELIDVKWGVTLTRLEQDEKGVTAYFEDGSQASGDFLIGADGIHSKVRNLVFGDAAPSPVFSERIVVNGFVSASDIVKPADFQLPAFMFTSAGMFMAIPIDPKGETIAWGINKSVAEDRTREGWQEFEKSGEAARFAKGDFTSIQTEPVRSILDKSSNEEARLWAPSYFPEQPSWHKGRICLIGDAAHALPPNGMGSGLAFEDAALLTRLLLAAKERAGANEDAVDFDAVFAALEKVRRPRIEDVRKGNPVAGMGKQSGPWLGTSRRWPCEHTSGGRAGR